jgi:hypothetical protein
MKAKLDSERRVVADIVCGTDESDAAPRLTFAGS